MILEYGGKDATEDFYGLHRHEILEQYSKLKIGKVEGSVTRETPGFGEFSNVPYAEAPFWRGLHSNYYNESHKKYRADVRKFFANEIQPLAEEYELSNEQIPKEIQVKLGKEGIFAALLGVGEHLKQMPKLPGGIKPEEFDTFHELITQEELFRIPTPGFIDGVVGGRQISVPVLFKFGNERMKKIAMEGLLGEIDSSLAITEPFVGSDVANLRTAAVKSPCGKFYIVNGVKKWITQGHSSKYFVTAVRTGKKGNKGISVLLIERTEGVYTKLIKTSYSTAAGTALVFFENAKVPVENLIGEENQGFKIVMFNFNHERWGIVVGMLSKCRFILDECFKWSSQRIIFGKKLIEQPVIQQKLASMASRLEACYAWLENITFQMSKMSFKEANLRIGGDIALLKFEAAQCAELIQREAVQIFGGRGLTKTGMGKYVERFQSHIKLPGVYGGSSEIMASLGVKQAVRAFPKESKL